MGSFGFSIRFLETETISYHISDHICRWGRVYNLFANQHYKAQEKTKRIRKIKTTVSDKPSTHD